MIPVPTSNRRILIDDCDAAGVVFGPRLLALAHQAYEEALADAGLDLAAVVRGGELALPYVHLDCEFSGPLRHGDRAEFTVSCERIGTTSYGIRIAVACAGRPCAQVTQAHVAIDPRTRAKTPLPEAVRTALAALTTCST